MAPSEPSHYVTLISNDGFEFIVQRDAACVAGTIRKMLDPQSRFVEAMTGRCHLSTLNAAILEKVIEYLYYNLKHRDAKDVPDMEIPADMCLELLLAADYLDV
ncbi:MAG: elongin C [Ramalina farinacea]|uniref:Elongin-C n=1 Tax=Ramalina farinacea TaxID=258253 RepID=A0AA43QJL0_9LECA|nr:elongin C [Ramalina farinacea]